MSHSNRQWVRQGRLCALSFTFSSVRPPVQQQPIHCCDKRAGGKKEKKKERESWPKEMPKAHTELKGDKGRWDRQGEKERGGYSCLIACPTCRLDVSRCPIYSCSLSLLFFPLFSPRSRTGLRDGGRLPAFDCLVIRRLVAHRSR